MNPYTRRKRRARRTSCARFIRKVKREYVTRLTTEVRLRALVKIPPEGFESPDYYSEIVRLMALSEIVI